MNMPVVEKMGKNRRIEFNPASTDFIDWLTVSFRLFTDRDLAARNVLVGERETCKVTDFGMARDVQQENIYEKRTRVSELGTKNN